MPRQTAANRSRLHQSWTVLNYHERYGPTAESDNDKEYPDMNEQDRKSVTERLQALDGRIKEFRHKLEHHGIYDDNHEMTEKNLKLRMNEVEQEVANRIASGEEAREKVGWLEKQLEKWVVSTDFDYKS
jgi:hypothetical protein